MLRHLAVEVRDGRVVFAFALEAWRDAADESFDVGDEVFGYVAGGEVTVEQYA